MDEKMTLRKTFYVLANAKVINNNLPAYLKLKRVFVSQEREIRRLQKSLDKKHKQIQKLDDKIKALKRGI